MLDQLHEDLNRVKQKKYVEMPDLNADDATVARTYWDLHLQRNQSIVVDLVQGQFKSTLTCPICSHVKISFDPYMTVQLPIPQVTKVSYFYLSSKLTDKTFEGQISLKPSEAEQSLMTIKQRIAVHASEFHRRDVQAYDFVLAIVSRDKFKLTCVLDEHHANARSLQLNPETHYLFVFEIDPLARAPQHDVTPNWHGSKVDSVEEEKEEDSFPEELEGHPVPTLKSSLQVIEPSWIQVPVFQTQRFKKKEKSYGWG